MGNHGYPFFLFKKYLANIPHLKNNAGEGDF